MSPREQQAFMQGVLLGAAMIAHQQRQEIAALDQRMRRVERWLWSALRIMRRLVLVGRRNGQRIYRMG